MESAVVLFNNMMSKTGLTDKQIAEKNTYIGGSSAHLLWEGNWSKLWKRLNGLEKTDFMQPHIQLGHQTEYFNIVWQGNAQGWELKFPKDVIRHSDKHPYIGALVDAIGKDNKGEFVIDAKHTNSYRGNYESIEDRIEQTYYWQAQNNMLATGIGRFCITAFAGNKLLDPIWIDAHRDHQEQLFELQKEFWWYMEKNKCPLDQEALDEIEIKKTGMITVDMTGNNEWANCAHGYMETEQSARDHEVYKKEIKKLVKANVKEATGHGIKITRNKAGSLSIKKYVNEEKAA